MLNEINRAIDTEPALPQYDIRVSDKLILRAIPLEHTLDNAQLYEKQIRKVIKAADGIFPEYFPPDMDNISVFARIYNDYLTAIRPYYAKIADMALEEGKEAIVADPAHGDSFALVAFPFLLAGDALFFTGLRILASDGIDRFNAWVETNLQKKQIIEDRIKRRTLFKFSGQVIGGTVLAATGYAMRLNEADYYADKPVPIPSAPEFRRAVITKAAVVEGELMDRNPSVQKSTYLLFYPRIHARGIADLAANRPRLDFEFEAAKQLRYINPAMTSYIDREIFTFRRFKPKNGLWVPDGRVSLVK